MGARLFGSERVVRAPLPAPPFAARFLRAVRPDVLVLEYLEWYPAWLRACARRGVPVVVIDGRISERSLRIKRLLEPTASLFTAFGARSQRDAENALRMGIPPDRVQVTGNGKYDGFPAGPSAPSAELRGIVGERDVVIGSLHPDEERACVAAIAASNARVLLAPRYLRRIRPLEKRLQRLGISVARRTAGESMARVMLLDTFGELASAYQFAPVAIVGGTFGGRGGQTLFEPALHNRLIVHGPNTTNIAEEADCLADHGATRVGSIAEAFDCLERFTVTEPVHTARAIRRLRGATKKNLALLDIAIAKGVQPA